MNSPDIVVRELGQLVGVRHRRLGLRRVMTDLEVAASSALTGRPGEWGTRLLPHVAALREAWTVHVNGTEGAGGLWEQIRTDAPRLDGHLRLLKREHVAVGAEIEALHADLTETDRDELRAFEVRDRVVALLARLARHRQRGADLIYEAYQHDIGGME